MASVAEIDGLTVPTGAPAVPSPAAAYSVRLLDSAVGVPTYTGAAMRIRRVTGTGNTGNDDEADVAFDTSLTEPTISLDSAVSNFSAGGSNATTLGQFLNVGTVGGTTYTDADSLAPNTAAAYVDEWKDQSGNANHATQGTPSNQPQIHSGLASTDLILENGKPALIFSTHSFSTSVSLSQPYTGISVGGIGSGVSRFDALYGTSLARGPHIRTQTSPWLYGLYSGVVLQGTTGASSQDLLTCLYNSTTSTMNLNGASIASGNIGTNNPSNLEIGDANQNWDGQIQEVIFYDSDQSSNRTAIESNVNTYFSIY